MTSQALNRPVDVLVGERDARTIYDIACIREEQLGASREDVEFKAIALRNYRFCAAVAELIEAAGRVLVHRVGDLPNLGYIRDNDQSRKDIAAFAAALAAVKVTP